VPFVIKPPAGRGGAAGVSDAVVELVDFYATALDYAGIEAPWPHFGRSLAPLLDGSAHEHREVAFAEGGVSAGQAICDMRHVQEYGSSSEYWPVQKPLLEHHPSTDRATMCRSRRYKYIHRLSDSDELYDLERDPDESRNRIDDPGLADVAQDMRNRIMHWYLATGGVVPPHRDKRGFLGRM